MGPRYARTRWRRKTHIALPAASNGQRRCWRVPRVTKVALAAGFTEPSSFSAAFRRATGFTPSEFRRVIM
ncbi:MAG: helix-turn-helix domain-containing protein [Pseudolabrys sp.]